MQQNLICRKDKFFFADYQGWREHYKACWKKGIFIFSKLNPDGRGKKLDQNCNALIFR
jgi:hypothetical protein